MKSYKDTPIFRKAEEITETLLAITALFPEGNEMLSTAKQHLIEDSLTIQAKLAGALETKLYDLKMENAAFIRKAARDIMVSYHTLDIAGFEEVEYYKLVREQIEEFRLLFVEWVQQFNSKHFITDSWVCSIRREFPMITNSLTMSWTFWMKTTIGRRTKKPFSVRRKGLSL